MSFDSRRFKRLAAMGGMLRSVRSCLDLQAERLKLQTMAVVARELLPLLNNANDEEIIRFTRVLEKITRTPHHRIQIQQLRELWQQGHPSLTLARRILCDLHPNGREKFLEVLAVKATWLGELKRREIKRREGFRPPYFAVISPTNRCNLRCTGCYSGLYPRGLKDPMSFDTFDHIIRDCKEIGIHFFTISGGEPLMRKDLFEIFERHSDCFFLIYTNGTHFTDQIVDRLAALGNATPAFSVEGSEELTRQRRGPGVWEKVMEAMDRLREARLLFGYSATASVMNADVLADWDFVDLMIAKGCLYGWVFLMTPTGQDDDPALMPTPDQRDRLREHAMEIRRKRPLFVADFWNDGCLTDGCMSGGSAYFHVNFQGDIEPCVFVHFATHNVHDLYASGGHLKEVVLHSPLFRALRERNRKDPNRLRPCPIIDHNEDLEEVITQVGARPTHVGAESVVTKHKAAIREWGKVYAELADRAWNSGEYDFFKHGSHLFLADEADWTQAPETGAGG